jgi:hypothetical protein
MQKGFNWSGITDEGDGTYTTRGKREKTRLLKSLHSSGYAVRSRKNPDGSWKVTAVGALSPKRRRAFPRRSSVSGYRPVTRARRGTGRYIPIASMRKRYRYGPRPRPMIHPGGMGGPSGGPARQGRGIGASIFDYLGERQKRRQAEIAERKRQSEDAKITDEKMRKDRIEQERQETQKQLKKQEFERDKLRFEEQQRAHQEAQDVKERRHIEFQMSRGGIQVAREEKRNWWDVKGPGETKVDQTNLQAEREKEVTGGS